MAQTAVPPEVLEASVQAVAQYGTITAAADALGLPRGTLSHRWHTAKRLGMVEARPPDPVASIREPLASFEDAWAQWMRAVGMAKDRYTASPLRADGPTKKILVVPDLHAPFHEVEMFAAMCEAEADANHAVCIGDIGDAYALSRFLKYERMPYRDEWASVTLVMQELAHRFPQVTVIIGNHDARLEKQLRTHLTEDMVDAIQCMTGGILCPITALAKRYPNVSIARHETPSGRSVDWFAMVGDAWLGHPEKYSASLGRR